MTGSAGQNVAPSTRDVLAACTADPPASVVAIDCELGMVGPGVDRLLAESGASEHLAAHEDALRLAITEVVTNAVLHNCSAEFDGQIRLSLWSSPRGAVAQIAERGPPLPPPVIAFLCEAGPECPDPESLPENGWGLFLVRQTVDRVSVARVGDWNEINLETRSGE